MKTDTSWLHRNTNRAAFGLVQLIAAGMLLAGCVAPSEPPRSGTVTTRSPAATSAAGFGVSAESPVARAALVQLCRDYGGCTLQPVDTETGLPVTDAPALATGMYPLHALSPNGRILATISYPSSAAQTRGSLLLTDLESWTTITTTVPISYVFANPVFSPDGSKLAMVREAIGTLPDRNLKIVNIVQEYAPSGRDTVLSAYDGGTSDSLPLVPILIGFARDGASLNIYGNNAEKVGMTYNPETMIARYDVATLAQEWQMALPEVLDGQYLTAEDEETVTPNYWDPHVGEWWQPARVFSHDGDTLYLVHANEERMTVVDFINHSVASVDVAPATSWLERLLALTALPAYAKILNGTQLEAALSLDGAQLYVTGMERDYTNDTYNEEYLPLRIIATENGEVLATGAKGTIAEPTSVELRLYLNVYDYDESHPFSTEWTVIANPGTGESMQEIEDWRIFPARRLDGAALVVGSKSSGRGELAIFDPSDFTPMPVELDFNRSWGSWLLQ